MPKLVDHPDVFGNTVFCDDVRQEVNGKLLYIGVYQAVMTVQTQLPFRLPAFCFSISLSQRVSVFKPRITYRIYLPGDPSDESSDEASIVAETDETTAGSQLKLADNMSDAAGIPHEQRRFVHSYANMAFQQLEIKEAGMIKVRADIGANRYSIGSLMVALGNTASVQT